jgi:hypothetical protein
MSASLKRIIFLFGAVLSLMLPAFINGYPLVYSDTSTYLNSGFTLSMPYDRPMTYGLFLRVSSLNGISLWTVIGMQCLLLAILVFRLLGEFLEENRASFYGFVIVFSLSLLTGVSWTASQLMPDIFTPIMFLCALLLLTGQLSRIEQVLIYLLFFFASSMHLSHLLVNLAFLGTVFIARELTFLKLKQAITIRPLIILLALSLTLFLTAGSALSKSRHIFLMGAFVEHGIVKRYLDEYCESKAYELCNYKDSLPSSAWQFVWNERSPLQQMGGWKETRQEYNEIIKGTFSSPKYLAMHFRESINATVCQLLRFNIGDGNGSFPEGTLLHERMGLYMPRELHAYEWSRQNRGILLIRPWILRLHQGVIAASLLGLAFMLIRTRKASNYRRLQLVCGMVLLGILINAWACGTFANAIDRLGCKMIWFIPLLSTLSISLSRRLH